MWSDECIISSYLASSLYPDRSYYQSKNGTYLIVLPVPAPYFRDSTQSVDLVILRGPECYGFEDFQAIWRSQMTGSFTYDHRTLKIRLPVRSAIYKQCTGGLVVRWVTTSESPLLYVFCSFLLHGMAGCHVHVFVTPRQNLVVEEYRLAESPLVSNCRTQVLLLYS